MYSLKVIRGNNIGTEWTLEDGTFVVGRDLNNAICLPDLHVSRQHFQLSVANGVCTVENISRTNGTFVNGDPITKSTLKPKDIIMVGETMMEFVKDASSPESPLELADDGVSTVMWLREDIEKQADENINYTVNARSTDILGIEEAGIEIEALRGAARRLQMIQDFSNTLVSEFDIKKLMQLLLDKIFEVIPGDRGYIFSIDQEKDMLVLQAAAEKGAAEPPTDIQISHSLVRRALDEKIGILSADTLSDERFKDQGSIILSGMRSAMCVPLIFADEALGIIHLDSKSMANQFSQDDLKMLTLIANQAAISIRNNSLREQAVKDRTVRASLSSYVSPHLLDRILSNEINIDSAAQQVEVSLLFADIRGFTALSEELEPADVMELLNQYCGKMANIVFEHNGSIDKYIGDAIMAVFGSPQPEPDHARRAIECGIAMQQAAKDLSVGARPVYIGVGVHTGACVQGNLGGSGMIQFTAVGDAVNTASRLCSAAKPGQVIISADTLAEANAVDFQIDPMPPIELKGKSQPMEVYQVRVPGHSSVPIVQQQG